MTYFPKANLVNNLNLEKFYVIAVVSNPIRYYSRARLFHQFKEHMTKKGANFVIVEAAYGTRPHALTEKNRHFNQPPVYLNANPNALSNFVIAPHEAAIAAQYNKKEFHIQLKTESEIWHKENMINIAVQQLTMLDPEWQYVAWIDADVAFQREDILLETAQQLQHYDIVQMFSHVQDLGPNYEPVNNLQNGFMWSYVQNNYELPQGAGYGGYYGGYGTKGKFWHCGYAWAMRRRAAEKIILFDKAILGSADHHMAMGLIGGAFKSIPSNVTPKYREAVLEWERMAVDRLRKNVGYVPGMITHYWHGNKVNRKYVDRWKILIDNQYDPTTDISRDPAGLYKINIHNGDRGIKLRDDIRRYFRERNEDSIDVE